jgi:hypothetical protein
MLLGFAVLQDQENAHAGIHDGSIGLGVKFEAVLVTKSGATLRLMRHEVAESAGDENVRCRSIWHGLTGPPLVRKICYNEFWKVYSKFGDWEPSRGNAKKHD